MQAISKPDQQEDVELPAQEPSPVAAGDVVDGKYTIDAIIGVGGMGVVAAGTHTALGQRVAIKVLRKSRMNPLSAERFLREARAAVSLKSSHVAKVLDVGMLENGLPFMVMELLEGEDLCTKLEKRRSLPSAEAIDYILQACDAISEAHALGIVHRDLKPENLFVTERRDGTPLVKVLDFGISKITTKAEVSDPALPTSGRTITHESTVMGSPMYMSPEQVRSAKNVDARADIWALGAILYELVAGRGPFWAETVPEIFVRVLDKPARILTDLVPDAPPGLADAVAKCLHKDREKRFQTVDELAAALANLGVRPTAPTIPPWDRSTDIEVLPGSVPPAAPANAVDAGATAVAAPPPPPPPSAPSAPRVAAANPLRPPTPAPLRVAALTPARPVTPAATTVEEAPPLPPPRRPQAETFVLPDGPKARKSKLKIVVALLGLAGIAIGAMAVLRPSAMPWSAALSATASPSPTQTDSVPSPSAAPTNLAAASSASSAPASDSSNAVATAGASASAESMVHAAPGAPRKRGGGSGGRRQPVTSSPPPTAPNVASPAPTTPQPGSSPSTHRRTDW